MDKKYFLGIDGGSTRSRLVLLNLKGKKVFEVEGRCLSHRNIPEEEFIQNVSNLVTKIKNRKILFGCFSLAAIDTEKDREKVIKLINKIVNFPFAVVSDIEGVLPSLNLENGAVIIAGTGSNYYAKNGNLVAKAGGLDYILSDEGSAFSIGQKVLRAAVRSRDGRGEKTILERLVLKKAKIKDMREIVNLIYTKTLKSNVGEFAPLLEKACKKKDKVAVRIISSVIDELENGVGTVIKKVKLKGNFKIALVGGVFKNKFLLTRLEKRVKKRFKKAKIIIVKNPALGAAKLAIKEQEKYYGNNR